MILDFKGLGSPSSAGARTERSGKQATEKSPESTTGASQASGSPHSVKLSDQAQSLSALSGKIQDLPEVNMQRVEEIRTALANGEYKIDDLVVADKLIAAEALFSK